MRHNIWRAGWNLYLKLNEMGLVLQTGCGKVDTKESCRKVSNNATDGVYDAERWKV